MDKVTLAEAAKAAGVHRNTLSNWLKAGRLRTAEKVVSRGNTVWIVDLSEVLAIAQQSHLHPAQQPVEYNVNQEPPQTPSQPPNVAIIPAEAYNTLVDLVKSQGEQIKELSRENGMLAERVKNLETTFQFGKVEPPATADPTPPEPKKRWWQR